MALLPPLLPEQQGMAQALQHQRGQGIGLQLRAHRPQPGAVAGASHAAIELSQHLL